MPHVPFAVFRRTGTNFLEISVTTIELLGWHISYASGGYFRLIPYRWSRRCLSRLAGDLGRTTAIYFPPCEIDPDQPKARGQPFRSKLRHYSGLSAMERKLKRLLADFR